MQRRTLLLAPFLLRPGQSRPVAVRDPDQLDAAIRAARPGDTILMEDGVWNNADIRFEGEGAWGQPITLRAQTAGKVILTGSSRLRMAGRFLVAGGLWFRDGFSTGEAVSFRTSSARTASYCRLTRCAITGYSPPDPTPDTKWVSVYGFRNRVDRCYFAGKTNTGATLVVWLPASSAPNYHWIERNHFGPRPPLGANGAETIRVGDSATSMNSSGAVVEMNYFEACNGEIEIISNKSCENVYRFNTFEQCEGTLTLRHGNRCLAEGNFFFGHGQPRTGGVRIIGEDHRVVNNYFDRLTGTGTRAAISMMNGIPESPLNGYFQVRRALVAFNTTVQCAQPLAVGVVGESSRQILAPEQCVVANNLFHGTRTPLVNLADTRAEIAWGSNLFDGAAPGLDGASRVEVVLVETDPGYWVPHPDSPAIGAAGESFAEAARDILGRPRPETADIGCFQSSDAAPLRGRLSASETGPDWLPHEVRGS